MVLDQLDRAYVNYYELYIKLGDLGMYDYAKIYKDLLFIINMHRDALRGEK